MQSVPITTKVVSLNPIHGEVYSMQQYVITFVSDLWQVGGFLYTTLCDKVCQWLATGRWFSLGTPASSTNKTDSHDITEILLKVTLNAKTNLKQTNLSLLKFRLRFSPVSRYSKNIVDWRLIPPLFFQRIFYLYNVWDLEDSCLGVLHWIM
jgi:hypothetical protein